MSNTTSTLTASNGAASDETIIVGIGASAGGIEALSEFFDQVQPDSGIAYVVILHLSPDYDSKLTHILQNITPIPVMQVTEKVKVVPNHVYVVPPNKHLQMEDGTIIVVPNTHVDDRRAPVDIFFRTLAESHGARAIAVILSGTGANGSMGLKRIKENGGGVFVQSPREAVFSEMPRHAIATDLVDEVLPVAQIPARLQTYRQRLGTITIPVEPQERPEDQQQALREVFTQLRLRTGHDFSNYKRPTLLRRLARRIHVRNLPDLTAYVAFLHENPEEVQALLKDLLISVTNFFRDSKVFTALEQDVIPSLISGKKNGDTIRIWVAGCATGEEAYSLAILLAECTIDTLDTPDIQIFATDIDEDAIATAREGLYTLNDAADVSPERLRRFFSKEGDEYRVRREIREMILFAHHNVLKDPPFSRLDLMSCRNLLIYLNQTAQERILETFHFALNPGGYLLMGQSETVDGSNDLYVTLSREHHLYQSRQVSARSYPVPEGIPAFPAERRRQSTLPAETESRPPLRLNYGDLHQQLLEQYAPPSIVVNEEYDILHVSERAGRYLHVAGGEPTKNLLKLIRPELRLELRTAFIQAAQRQTNVAIRNLITRIDDQLETLTIHVRPVLREGDPAHGFILVLFEPMSDGTDEPDGVVASVEPAARHLEDELMRVKAQLRSSNEHHELQAEELKASNEELQAMNEELRSAAEELETSKEELQSINEELITVNQELKVKVEEISITSDNFQNLINSTDIATLFLDRSLRVKLFTPVTRQLFNLIPTDTGRPLTDITNRLDDQNLMADAARVLETLQPVEREVRSTDGVTFIMRVLPYRTIDDRISGIVITFVDITERKAAAETLRMSEERQRFLLQLSDVLRTYTSKPEILTVACQLLAEQLRADRINYAEVNGETYIVTHEYHRTGLPSIAGRYSIDSFRPAERAAFEAGRTVVIADIEAESNLTPDEAAAYASLNVQAFVSVPLVRAGKLAAVLGVIRSKLGPWKPEEVTLIEEMAERIWLVVERAQVEAELRESEERMRLFVTASSDIVYTMSADWQQMHYLVGKTFLADTSVTNPSWLEQYIPPEDQPNVQAMIREVISTKSPFELEHRVVQRDGTVGWVASRAIPLLNDQGDIVEWFGAASDITARKQAGEALRESEERQVFLLQLSDALRPLANPMAIQETVAHFAMNQFGADRCYYCQIENDLAIIQRDAAQAGLPSVAGIYPLRSFPLIKSVVDAGRPFVVSDVYTTELVDESLRDLCIQLQVISFVNIPVIKDGQPVGVLCITHSTPKNWSSVNVELAQEIAERTWATVKRARTEEALRQSEEKYRAIFNSAGEGISLLDVQFDEQGQACDVIIQDANPAQNRMDGIQAMIGRRVREFLPDIEMKWIERYADIVRNGEAKHFEDWSEANQRWYDVNASRVGGAGSTLVAIMYNDITERKRREENQGLLANISKDLVELTHIDQAMERLGERLGHYFGVSWCVFSELIDDREISVSSYGWNREDVASLKGTYRMRNFLSDEQIERNNAGEPTIVDDVQTDLRVSAENYGALSIRSFIIVPLARDGQWQFLLSIIDTKARQWRPDEVELWQESANRIWTRLEQVRAEEDLRESEERLRLLIESANDFSILTLDTQGIINGWSEGARRLFGWTADEAIGQHGELIFTPEDRAAGAPEQEMQTARQQGRAPDERFHLRKDGSRFYVSGVLSLIGGGSQGFVKIARDMTERKQHEENQTFLAAVNEIFAGVTSPEEIMQLVGEKLYTRYELSRLTFVYVTSETGLVNVVYDRHEPSLASVLGDQRIADFVHPDYIREFQSSQPVAISDVMNDPRTATLSEAYQIFGKGAILLAPLLSDGQWRFAIALHKEETCIWRADQIELLNDLTPRLYLALERQRLEDLKRLTLLQQTEDLAKVGSWEYDRQTGQLNWSDGMYKLVEMKPGQPVQPEILFDVALEEDKLKARHLLSFLREGEGHFEDDLKLRIGEQIRTLRIKADVIGEGDQQRIIGVDLDITDQLSAQRQIQETAKNLQAVLDGSPAAIGLLKTICDPADAERIIDFELAVGNRKLAQFFERPLEKILGKSAERFSRLLWGGQTVDILRQVRLTGESRYDEQRLPIDGRWLGIAVTRQDDGVLVTALDISDLKTIQDQQQHWLNEVEASRENVDALGELRQSLQHRSELLRAVSHDLRGNFGVISSALQLLAMAVSEAERAQMMEMVLRNVRQATGMLTELLDYSRLEAGQEKRTIESFDVTPLLEELSQSMQSAADGQGLRLEHGGPPALVVEGDRLQVYRMAQNLTINAIKYTHKGHITVNWGRDPEQTRWWFSISDTGPGLDADLVARLNTNGEGDEAGRVTNQPRSASLDETTLGQPGASWTNLRGEGIGLRIVRQLAHLLEARLEVSSQVGVGTRFVIYFPLAYS